MFDRETILRSLNTENYYIDNHSLNLFLEDWKIESIYEDDDGLEFYDDLALEKIKKGISLKAQGYSDEQIIAKLARMEAKVDRNDEPIKPIQPLLVSELLEETSQEIHQEEYQEPEQEPIETTEEPAPVVVVEEPKQTQPETIPQGKSFTLDVSSQTLQMLAEAVAKKICDDITNSDMTSKLIEAGGYKRDNEILAKQIRELLEHNKELSQRIEQLEGKASKNFWQRFWKGR